ncbi:MAG TPA: hypothetical protein VFD16_03905 [Candidatus Saccharimonadales bacterium]|nr:hypothetical protein [Candidatus Saccharimonadales bacterium]
MKIRAKSVIKILVLLMIVVFIFIVGVILSGRYILVIQNLDSGGDIKTNQTVKNNFLFSDSGLPVEIINKNDSAFLAFINTSAKDGESGYFQKMADSDLFLVNINNAVSIVGDGSASSTNFFNVDGQPLFFKSDPVYYGESISYSRDGNYALEISTSEPDSSASLWDLKNKKVYFIAQCGTACNLRGGYWLDNNQAVVFGISEDYNVIQDKFLEVRFINIYDLSKNIKTVYSDKD